MIKVKKNKIMQSFDLVNKIKGMILYHHHGGGLAFLLVTLAALSLLAGWQAEPATRLYLAGEIAEGDVAANRDMLVEDTGATQFRRNQAMLVQPLIFDLDKESVARFRSDTLDLLHMLNTMGLDEDGLTELAGRFNESHGARLERNAFRVLSQDKAQRYLLDDVVPWLETLLNEGVLPDMRQLSSVQNTAIVRDVGSGAEVVRTQATGLHDQRSLLVALGQHVRAASEIQAEAKTAIQDIMAFLVLPTLALNQDATNQRNEEILRAVEPVYYQVKRGEVVLRAGDKVSHEQQIVIQSLYNKNRAGLDTKVAGGSFLMGLLLCLGLFLTPSGNKGTVLQARDQVFIALLLLLFGLAAFLCTRFLLPEANTPLGTALAFGFPVAGGAGLAALIFSAKRYTSIGLLLSFYATLMLKGDFSMYLFFFLSAMFNTWLVLRAQSRQDVVWSGFPLTVWLLITGLGAGSLNHLGSPQAAAMLGALFFNSALSVFLLFAMSPIMEMSMGFTTRFRLMELMNLEQPLLQHMMMSTPGTYHHSLLVSCLVEAGAGAIGANGLLCKVGALYHDIGKLSRPDYFVENQLSGHNPHDKLTPSMSSLILGSHVKQGVELAHEYKLGREIGDIIAQHHGTRCISYFHQRAIALGENPRQEDYSYPGPKPQSSEAAIVMIADSVEASSRTMVEPTPARIRAHVEKIIMGIYAEGQLDESELTFKDLSKLSDSFARILIGLFHKRVEYPETPDPATPLERR